MAFIKIATDFSPAPLGRFVSDGPDSGERFREEFLVPAIRSGERISIDLDDAAGYGSSFLEEAFGGAVRREYIGAREFVDRLQIIADDPDFQIFKDLIVLFIERAGAPE